MRDRRAQDARHVGEHVEPAMLPRHLVDQRGRKVAIGHVTDDWRRAVQDFVHRGESSVRVALGEADDRPGITDLARAGQAVVQCCQRLPGLAELPEAGLGGQPEASQLARQRV